MFIENIFPTPILIFNIDSKIADKVEEEFLKKVDKLPKEPDQYSDFYESKKIFDLDKDVPMLKQQIVMARDFYAENSGLDVDEKYIDYWSQDYREEGQHHKKHNHGIYGISGVYWIRANSSAGEFKLYNPNPIIGYTRWSHHTPYNKTEHVISPSKGKMILFPSYMDHDVQPSGVDPIRSTLAFNFPLDQVFLPHGEPEDMPKDIIK